MGGGNAVTDRALTLSDNYPRLSEVQEAILRRIVEGDSVNSICKADDMPTKGTVFRWLNESDDFRTGYHLAKALYAETLFEEAMEIADAAPPMIVTQMADNRFVRLGWDVADAKRGKALLENAPELAARAMVLTLFVPVVGSLLGGRGPDEENEEAWTEWAAKESLYGLAAPIPFVRDVVPIATKKATGDRSYGYRFTPVAGMGESIERVAGDVRKLSEGDETTRATRNMIEMLGYMNGLTPTPFSGQMAATVQFLVDWSSGEVEPAGAGEVWEGVRSGRITE